MEKKPIGEVTHYYGHLGVAIVKFNKKTAVGDTIHFKGSHVDFKQEIGSMQFEHESIKEAKKGQEVGIKVDQKVHENDKVYEA